MSDSNTITRWAVLVRRGDGRVELLGQIHRTEAEARDMGGYWQRHMQETVQAEVVSFQVPTQGTPIADTRDVLPLLKQPKGES